MKTIYISSPVSFYQREWNNKVSTNLRNAGFKVHVPQEITPQKVKHINFSNYVYQTCIDMMQESDLGLLLLPYGKDCAWEAGYYRGMNKPFLIYVSVLNNVNLGFLRDWMVKGGLSNVIVDNKDLFKKLKKDPILKSKPIIEIDSFEKLPEYINFLIEDIYSKRDRTFLGVGAVVTKENKVLLVQEKEDSKFYFRRKGMWGFPTKIIKNDDPREQSLISLKKETGIVGSNPKFLSQQNIPNAIGLFYSVKIKSEQNLTNGKWFDIERILNDEIWMRPTYINVLKSQLNICD